MKLLTSKSEVADLKTISIHRLKLCATKLSVELAHHVKTTLIIHELEIYNWTDSDVVLHWLRKFPAELKV